MIKKLKKISIVSLILAVPVGLYCLVYFSNVDDYQVASVTEATPAVNPIVANQAKPIVFAAEEYLFCLELVLLESYTYPGIVSVL
jgi:hypothetical protein